jgi:endonuclease/exonuclease/phosphatase (EEP) superfamily protein YafD
VAARDLALRPAPALERVPYPPGSLEALAAEVPESFRSALDLERERGVSVAGAWITVGGTEVLFTVHDLQSAGWDGSPQDRLRALQAATIRERIDQERGVAPVVIAGDFNLVGSAWPLERLALDYDGRRLDPAAAVRLGEYTLATWEGPGQSFAPGRLDFILYPAWSIDVVDSFVFATEDLRPEVLHELALPRTLSSELSDHLVLVADMRLR